MGAIKYYRFYSNKHKAFIVKIGEFNNEDKKYDYHFLQMGIDKTSAQIYTYGHVKIYFNHHILTCETFAEKRHLDIGKKVTKTKGRKYWKNLIEVGFTPWNSPSKEEDEADIEYWRNIIKCISVYP